MASVVAPTPAPLWMSRWLVAAGVYNLAWGGLTVLVPNWLFDLTGLAPPNYPFIWQCVGMVVGVYGIGYLAASSDPVRHWPIVLVGLLGKVFGPLGYAIGLVRGDVPPAFGWTLPTNDLLWWIPFALIPLIRLTSDHALMGDDTNRRATAALGWAVTAVISLLNVVLIWLTLS